MSDFIKVNSTYNSTYVDMTDENEFYEIKNRKIIPPENPTKIIQTENNSQIITFITDRYQEGIDLATKRINIVCKNAMHKKYTFPAVNVYVNDTDLRFSWLIKRDVSIYHGMVLFKVEFLGDTDDIYETLTETDDTDYSLTTENCAIQVLKSINFNNASTSEQNYWYTDVLQQVGASILNSQNTYYGTCFTASGTAEKVVKCKGFELKEGAVIYVWFLAHNISSKPTLNVNNTGAIAINTYAKTVPPTSFWGLGSVKSFVYDGTAWKLTELPATTTFYGVTKLTDSLTDTSSSLALTQYAGNSLYKMAKTQSAITVNGVEGLGVEDGDTIPSGKTLEEIIKMLVQKAIPPTYIAPAVTIANNGGTASGNKEAGTTITPKLKATFNQNDAGILVKLAVLKGSNEIGSSTASPYAYTGSSIVLGDETITYKAQAAYADGSIKKDNLGNDDSTGQILAGTITSNSYSYVGKRKTFYGTTEGNLPELTSSVIRTLSKSSLGLNAGSSFTINVAVGQQNIIFAYPATLRDVNTVKYNEANDSSMADNFTKTLVNVADARGGSNGLMSYKVYTYHMATPATATMTFTVTI